MSSNLFALIFLFVFGMLMRSSTTGTVKKLFTLGAATCAATILFYGVIANNGLSLNAPQQKYTGNECIEEIELTVKESVVDALEILKVNASAYTFTCHYLTYIGYAPTELQKGVNTQTGKALIASSAVFNARWLSHSLYHEGYHVYLAKSGKERLFSDLPAIERYIMAEQAVVAESLGLHEDAAYLRTLDGTHNPESQ